jgi:hypothetical protein
MASDDIDAGPVFNPAKALGSLLAGAALLAVMFVEFKLVLMAIDALAHAMGAK